MKEFYMLADSDTEARMKICREMAELVVAQAKEIDKRDELLMSLVECAVNLIAQHEISHATDMTDENRSALFCSWAKLLSDVCGIEFQGISLTTGRAN
jgi:uncharacterized protein YceH (UPF0502 family)